MSPATKESSNLVLILSLTFSVVIFVISGAVILYIFLRGRTGSIETKKPNHSTPSNKSKSQRRSDASKRSAQVSPATCPLTMLDARFGTIVDSQLMLDVEIDQPSQSDLDLANFDLLKKQDQHSPPSSPKMTTQLPVNFPSLPKDGPSGSVRSRSKSRRSQVKRLPHVCSAKRPCNSLASKKSYEKSQSKSSSKKNTVASIRRK